MVLLRVPLVPLVRDGKVAIVYSVECEVYQDKWRKKTRRGVLAVCGITAVGSTKQTKKQAYVFI
jgi:hypothetical protein